MAIAPHHLFVCTSCRRAGEAREPRDGRSGAVLYRHLAQRFASWARREGFVIVAHDCLGVCSRPCGVAMRAPGKFAYVFGDIEPGASENALIECASLYRKSPNGFLPKEQRAVHGLRAAVLAHVPPLEMP